MAKTVGNLPVRSRPVGRPTAFRDEYVEQAEKLCRLGATDREMADFFGVVESTIYQWRNSHSAFREAIKNGKERADAEVAEKLYQRARGFSHDAVKIFMPAGAEEPIYAPYTERYPPETAAAIFWLKNRRPDLWRDVTRQERTGADGGPVEISVDDRRAAVRAIIDQAFGAAITIDGKGE